MKQLTTVYDNLYRIRVLLTPNNDLSRIVWLLPIAKT